MAIVKRKKKRKPPAVAAAPAIRVVVQVTGRNAPQGGRSRRELDRRILEDALRPIVRRMVARAVEDEMDIAISREALEDPRTYTHEEVVKILGL